LSQAKDDEQVEFLMMQAEAEERRLVLAALAALAGRLDLAA
jgi:hypothetical protein